ncbi:hypothetical protein XELAEV_18026921mg [Xenopus laevis]|uniref:Uncharacterized protein n=1 Tax=Xenopus laevis TaxID=8355 RepID=A0A974HJT5_XENLA|nr:hypothetical protein XELAEV_18026921mg [Xenopus laevis]
MKDCKQKFRDLELFQRKYVAYDLHLRTLAEYMKVNRIPRGLRVRLCPTLFASDKEFCTRWEAIINKCSSDLMLATMERLQTELPNVVAQGKEKLAHHVQGFHTEVETRKRSKFQRDANDYSNGRVYRWRHPTQESFGDSGFIAGERQTRPKQRRRDDISPGPRSESASSSASSFLGGSQTTEVAPGAREDGEKSITKKKGQAATRYRRKQW